MSENKNPEEKLKCPRCQHQKFMRFESKEGNEVQCLNCGSQFHEKDLREIKEKSDILTIKEKLGIVEAIRD